MRLQGEPKAMLGGVGCVVIEPNPSLASIASTPVQAEGTLPMLKPESFDRLLYQRN
jgi:hypothetical protein